MAVKKILTLGKSLKENIDDAYEKFITGGGKTGRNKKITIQKKDIDKKLSKQKQVDKAKENRAKKQKKTKKVADKKPSVKKLASDAKTKRNIKSKINKAEKVFSRKEYNKKLLDTLKSGKKNKTTALTVTKQPPKKTGTNLVTIPKGTNIVKKKTTSLTTIPKLSGAATGNKILNFLKRNKGKIGAGAVATLLPFAIGTDKNVGEGKNIGGGNKDKKPKKDFTPKVKKSPTPEVKIKKLPKAPTKTQKKSRSNIKGSSSYDAQFTYDNLVKRGGKKFAKARMSPENYAKVKKLSVGDKVGLKDLPPKSINPGIHKLPAKAKMNMGFKPMFGGGLIASFYDKPAKTEKYKGNTTSARQVKGYGKAKKKA